MLSEIHYGYVPVVTAFGKQIGDSLIAFGLGHQIVKHENDSFTVVYLDSRVCCSQSLSKVFSSKYHQREVAIVKKAI